MTDKHSHKYQPSKEHLEHCDIASIEIDLESFNIVSDKIISEVEIYINELIENAYFKVTDFTADKYALKITYHNHKFVIDSVKVGTEETKTHIFSLTPYRGVFGEYQHIKSVYQDVMAGTSSLQLETIDMARRGLHNEAAELIKERFASKISIDFETGRKIFSLMTVLLS
ncbi:MAG: UPF0262 family protein [Pseudomonadota bacterium]